jgi:hypothetical protein
MPDKRKRGRPRKDDTVIVDTNVRVDKRAHIRMKTLADLWGVTLSEAINRLIDKQAPEVDEVIRQREEQRKKFAQNEPDSSNN